MSQIIFTEQNIEWQIKGKSHLNNVVGLFELRGAQTLLNQLDNISLYIYYNVENLQMNMIHGVL